MSKIQIRQLVIYPIKGCKGQVLDSVEINEMGLVGDREFTLIFNGERANQKQVPLLYKLAAQWLGDHKLKLSFPDETDYVLDTRLGEVISPVTIYSKPVEILHLGNDVSQWLSKALQLDVKLVRVKSAIKWFFPLPEFSEISDKDQSKFVDAAPVLLTNDNSLHDLNQKIAGNEPPLKMDRFRANIVVSGLDAYLEDALPEFRFPHLKLNRLAVCERCIVTTTDQQSGVRAKEPLRTLAKYRKRSEHYAGGIMFGIYLAPVNEGRLTVGDVLETRPGES